MDVNLQAEHRFRAPRDAVFALALDPVRFPATFRGFGPIPAIRPITLHAPPAVGSTRELDNSDGSRPLERITALEQGRRHAYVLSRLRAPFSWLVRDAHADWTFVPEGDQTAVTWRYRFALTSALAWPIAAPLLHAFFATAMRRCLTAMDAALAAQPEPA